jgi:hypothetical protein
MFDRTDHPGSIPKPGRFPLIVDPLVGTTRLTKALADGGSNLNLMYFDTFKGLGLTRDQLQSSPHLFYGVVLGKQFIPLGRVTLLVTFGDVSNYRTEMLTIEVVYFSSPYHVILGRSCFVKFMAIPSYTSLKLKIPGPAGIITVEAKAQQALDCERDSIELILRLHIEPLSLVMPPMPIIFETDEDAKTVQIGVRDLAKTLQIGTRLDPK